MHTPHHSRCGVAFALAAVSLVMSCDSIANTPTRDSHSTSYRAAGMQFRTSQYVDASQLGLKGDGHTDNTNALRAALRTGGRTIHIGAGDYVTGKLSIPGNTVLLLDPGVTIRDSGRLGPNDPLITIGTQNVYIRGRGAKVISNRANYTSGEQRHGVFIYGASNVVIDGLESSGNSGDGFYIGGGATDPAQNITLRSCIASNNRRQGLSIVSARRVNVIDCRFDHTRGTSPQFGIDLEPNHPSDVLENINIIRAQTDANFGGGILIALLRLNKSSPKVTIRIVHHVSVNERDPYRTVGLDGVPAIIDYSKGR